jgi:hypothetical protein
MAIGTDRVERREIGGITGSLANTIRRAAEKRLTAIVGKTVDQAAPGICVSSP